MELGVLQPHVDLSPYTEQDRPLEQRPAIHTGQEMEMGVSQDPCDGLRQANRNLARHPLRPHRQQWTLLQLTGVEQAESVQ
ncbi:hypothetical protein D3C78_1312850 [compost metagenome]